MQERVLNGLLETTAGWDERTYQQFGQEFVQFSLDKEIDRNGQEQGGFAFYTEKDSISLTREAAVDLALLILEFFEPDKSPEVVTNDGRTNNNG